MNLSTRIALRYIFTLRKFHFITVITIISVIGIVVGVAALIAVVSIFNGFREFTEQQLIGFDPHIRISAAKGAWLKESDSLTAKIKNIPGIESASPLIQDKAVIINGNNLQVTIINAVKPESIRNVSGIARRMIMGEFDVVGGNNYPGLVLGTGLAERLRALPGDTVYIISPEMIEASVRTFRRVGGVQVVVTGIFQSNSKEYDETYSYTTREAGQILFHPPDNASTSIDIRLKSLNNINKVRKELTGIIPSGTTILTWYDLHKELYNIMQFERIGSFIVISLIVMIAVFNVLASLSMTVVEKQADIATLKAIGGTDKFIRNIYLKEGLIIGTLSTALGTAAGLAFSFGQIKYGWFKLDTTKYLISSIPVSVHLSDIIIIVSFSLFLSFFATLYPSYRAAKTSAVHTLREE